MVMFELVKRKRDLPVVTGSLQQRFIRKKNYVKDKLFKEFQKIELLAKNRQ